MSTHAKSLPAVVVTGASSGIGAATALHLAARGYRVFAGVRREADGAALLKEAPAGTLEPLLFDVTDAVQRAAALKQVAGAVGAAGLAGIVSNAGTVVFGALEELPLDELRAQFEINFFGAVGFIQAFLPLVRQGKGRVVVMSSISGKLSMPFIAPYCSSKFALEAFADALRLELAPEGLFVSLIEPGAVRTPIFEKAGKAAEARMQAWSAELKSRYGSRVAALKRVTAESFEKAVKPEKVARVVEQALTARKPKPRYVIGSEAPWVSLFLRLTTDRLRDAVILGQLKPKKGE